MVRFLSRVADKNKPLFVFNQKMKMRGDSSDSDSGAGTPSFSMVSIITHKWTKCLFNETI